jgi:hypothetical protein
MAIPPIATKASTLLLEEVPTSHAILNFLSIKDKHTPLCLPFHITLFFLLGKPTTSQAHTHITCGHVIQLLLL